MIAYFLKNDKNKNVNNLFQTINLKEFPIPEEQKTSSNHLFINKMSFIMEEFELTKNLPLFSKLKNTASNLNLGCIASNQKKSKEIISEKYDIDSEKDNFVKNDENK